MGGCGERGGPAQGLSAGTPDMPLPPSQLVAGVKYYLTLEMASTACRKNTMAGDLTTCPLAVGEQQEVTAPPPTPLRSPRDLWVSSLNWSGWPG